MKSVITFATIVLTLVFTVTDSTAQAAVKPTKARAAQVLQADALAKLKAELKAELEAEAKNKAETEEKVQAEAKAQAEVDAKAAIKAEEIAKEDASRKLERSPELVAMKETVKTIKNKMRDPDSFKIREAFTTNKLRTSWGNREFFAICGSYSGKNRFGGTEVTFFYTQVFTDNPSAPMIESDRKDSLIGQVGEFGGGYLFFNVRSSFCDIKNKAPKQIEFNN